MINFQKDFDITTVGVQRLKFKVREMCHQKFAIITLVSWHIMTNLLLIYYLIKNNDKKLLFVLRWARSIFTVFIVIFYLITVPLLSWVGWKSHRAAALEHMSTFLT